MHLVPQEKWNWNCPEDNPYWKQREQQNNIKSNNNNEIVEFLLWTPELYFKNISHLYHTYQANASLGALHIKTQFKTNS